MSWLAPFQLFNNLLWQVAPAFFQGLIFFIYLSPIFLAFLLWQTYLLYIRAGYIARKRVMFEVRIPKEVTKSPKAMELLMEVFYQTYEGELIDKYIHGSVRDWFSLELVSLGGKIRFFLNIPAFFKNIVETRIYSQYPEAEIFEVEDYTKEVTFGQPNSPWNIMCFEYSLSEPDAYPIKTYIDYELDRDPKEEFKIEPMTPLLEAISMIKPTEQIWIQILIMGAKKRFIKEKKKEKDWFFFKTKHREKKEVDWKASGRDLVDELMSRNKEVKDMSAWVKMNLTNTERDVLASIQRNLSKPAFDVGIRSIYASTTGLRPEVFVGFNSAFKQYGAEGLNSFKNSHLTGFPNPWQDPLGWRVKWRKTQFFKFFCNRSYFYPPASRKPMGLTSEELATIYHFPGQVATTPNLERITSKRGEPPANLPI
ncbi:MAG: hypothetical protein WC385_03430 [Candidatus Paceibacterota bacterium]|jgi:hypothetical protein